MSLEEWCRNGWLMQHTTTPEEIRDMLAGADRDLASAKTPGLHVDWRLNIAYNAALECAAVALAACGYRAPREAHHFRVIGSLVHTIGPELQDTVEQFDQFRKKRNISVYTRPGVASEKEFQEMLELAGNLHSLVEAWLKANHPHLLR